MNLDHWRTYESTSFSFFFSDIDNCYVWVPRHPRGAHPLGGFAAGAWVLWAAIRWGSHPLAHPQRPYSRWLLQEPPHEHYHYCAQPSSGSMEKKRRHCCLLTVLDDLSVSYSHFDHIVPNGFSPFYGSNSLETSLVSRKKAWLIRGTNSYVLFSGDIDNLLFFLVSRPQNWKRKKIPSSVY